MNQKNIVRRNDSGLAVKAQEAPKAKRRDKLRLAPVCWGVLDGKKGRKTKTNHKNKLWK